MAEKFIQPEMKILVLITTFLCLSVNFFAQQTNIETLIKAAQAIRAKGEVRLQVNVDANGKAISAKTDSQIPFLKIVAERIALELQFEKSESIAPHIEDLIVNFSDGEWKIIDESEAELSYGFRTKFSPPSRVDVFFDTFVPKRLLLPRENGVVKPEYCELHKVLMKTEVLPIGYGLRVWNDENFGKKYEKAENKLFRNANSEIGGGCVDNGIKEQETYFCEICRMKRKEWLQKNH
ncbi:MAG: hypothetical protein K1X72_09325 [Pyrinomonadaceae bacterium]|nr:hypothetical protein [Pyrinomonadaceae bacterium]